MTMMKQFNNLTRTLLAISLLLANTAAAAVNADVNPSISNQTSSSSLSSHPPVASENAASPPASVSSPSKPSSPSKLAPSGPHHGAPASPPAAAADDAAVPTDQRPAQPAHDQSQPAPPSSVAAVTPGGQPGGAADAPALPVVMETPRPEEAAKASDTTNTDDFAQEEILNSTSFTTERAGTCNTSTYSLLLQFVSHSHRSICFLCFFGNQRRKPKSKDLVVAYGCNG